MQSEEFLHQLVSTLRHREHELAERVIPDLSSGRSMVREEHQLLVPLLGLADDGHQLLLLLRAVER